MNQYELAAKKVRTVFGGTAWWYAEDDAITLYAESQPGTIMRIRLPLSKLREFVKRADAKKGRR